MDGREDIDVVSRKQFAEWCVASLNVHEASYDPAMNYTKSWDQAVGETVPSEWRDVVLCLMIAGYADIWDWCKEQGVELS